MINTTTRKRRTCVRYLRPGDAIHLSYTGRAIVVSCDRTGPGDTYRLEYCDSCTFERRSETLSGGALIDVER